MFSNNVLIHFFTKKRVDICFKEACAILLKTLWKTKAIIWNAKYQNIKDGFLKSIRSMKESRIKCNVEYDRAMRHWPTDQRSRVTVLLQWFTKLPIWAKWPCHVKLDLKMADLVLEQLSYATLSELVELLIAIIKITLQWEAVSRNLYSK